MKELDAKYWEERYRSHQTGWDIGYANPALTEYFKSQVSKEARILIPGAGHAYEAEWLLRHGYHNLSVLDWSSTALKEAKKRAPILEQAQLIQDNFFNHEGSYDLIVEQTFFCALDPQLRSNYVVKMKDLLNHGGILMGLWFNFPLTKEGPPFGGSEPEYRALFESHFTIKRFETARSSIKPREGREFFLELLA